MDEMVMPKKDTVVAHMLQKENYHTVRIHSLKKKQETKWKNESLEQLSYSRHNQQLKFRFNTSNII